MSGTYRTRFSEPRAGVPAATGLPANELWGTAQRNHGKPHRKRGASARDRRKAKRAAAQAGLTLKAYLRGLK